MPGCNEEILFSLAFRYSRFVSFYRETQPVSSALAALGGTTKLAGKLMSWFSCTFILLHICTAASGESTCAREAQTV